MTGLDSRARVWPILILVAIPLWSVQQAASFDDVCGETELLANDEGLAFFGGSVAIDGGTLVVSASGYSIPGSAHVYLFNGADWIEDEVLLATDGTEVDEFGSPLAVSGDVIVVGALNRADNGQGSGAAYVYRFNGTNWIEEAKLLASDGTEEDYFGWSVAVSGDLAVIGAFDAPETGFVSGAAYLYRFDGGNWIEEAKLIPSDGEDFDYFGQSVAIAGDKVLVGAHGHDAFGGAVYSFSYDGSTWSEMSKLSAAQGEWGDLFGYDIAADGNVALVGAKNDDDNGGSAGAAYVFRFDGANWQEEAKLLASDGAISDNFGTSVSIRESSAVIGSPDHDAAEINAGAVYLFRLEGDEWAEQAKFLASDSAMHDNLGRSVAVDADFVVAGAGAHDEHEGASGATYIFDHHDCNDNLVPDECDIEQGDSLDENADAIPDECQELCKSHEDCDDAIECTIDYCDFSCLLCVHLGVLCMCPGDMNDDGTIDPLDSGFVTARLGCPVGTGDPDCDAADVNDDGLVDPLDVGFVLSRFGVCP